MIMLMTTSFIATTKYLGTVVRAIQQLYNVQWQFEQYLAAAVRGTSALFSPLIFALLLLNTANMLLLAIGWVGPEHRLTRALLYDVMLAFGGIFPYPWGQHLYALYCLLFTAFYWAVMMARAAARRTATPPANEPLRLISDVVILSPGGGGGGRNRAANRFFVLQRVLSSAARKFPSTQGKDGLKEAGKCKSGKKEVVRDCATVVRRYYQTLIVLSKPYHYSACTSLFFAFFDLI